MRQHCVCMSSGNGDHGRRRRRNAPSRHHVVMSWIEDASISKLIDRSPCAVCLPRFRVAIVAKTIGRTICAPSPWLQGATRRRAMEARRSFGRAAACLSGELKEAIMRYYLPASLTGILFATMLYAGALAQQAPSTSPYAFERGFPTQEGAQRARDDADYQRAVTAYRFWYPTVSMEATFQGTRDVGVEDNKAAMI